MEYPNFHDRDGFIWFDGELIPWREANLHVLSHGLHYASSVFEGERAYNGKIFKLREHSQRLIDSASALEMDIPFSVEALDEATQKRLKPTDWQIATCGPSPGKAASRWA